MQLIRQNIAAKRETRLFVALRFHTANYNYHLKMNVNMNWLAWYQRLPLTRQIIWPKQPSFEAGSGRWSTTIAEANTAKEITCSIILIAANTNATEFLLQWFTVGPTGTDFPGISRADINRQGLSILAESRLIMGIAYT